MNLFLSSVITYAHVLYITSGLVRTENIITLYITAEPYSYSNNFHRLDGYHLFALPKMLVEAVIITKGVRDAW